MAGEAAQLAHRGWRFAVLGHPAVARMLPGVTGAFEAWTLDIFDAQLTVSFHLFNLGDGPDESRTAPRRRSAGRAAAVACYPMMDACTDGGWMRLAPANPMDLPRRNLLAPKPVEGIAPPQFGLTDSWTFSSVPIPGPA